MMKFIDVGCRLGKQKKPVGTIERTPEHILGVMDRFGIECSIVYHSAAEEGDIQLGNERLITELSGEKRLLPQWIVVPKTFDDGLSTYELLDAMKKNRVKTVRMAPKSQGFSLKKYASGELLSALSECRIPIFINRDQVSLETMYETCKAYPGATFVLCTAGWGSLRGYYPLLRDCKNFKIETGNFGDHGGIKLVCDHLGAEGLIFGSSSPNATSVSEAISVLMYSGISEEQKQMIAAGNAQKLLEEVSL